MSTMTSAQFKSYQNRIEQKKYPNSTDVFDLSVFYWQEIDSRRYEFDRVEAEREALLSAKPEDLTRYAQVKRIYFGAEKRPDNLLCDVIFQRMLGSKSSRRRKLAVQIFPTQVRAEKKNVPKSMVPAGVREAINLLVPQCHMPQYVFTICDPSLYYVTGSLCRGRY